MKSEYEFNELLPSIFSGFELLEDTLVEKFKMSRWDCWQKLFCAYTILNAERFGAPFLEDMFSAALAEYVQSRPTALDLDPDRPRN